MSGFCDADAVDLWSLVRADALAAGCISVKPLTWTPAFPADIAHHGLLPQVWLPLNYGGQWRLARINLVGGSVVTYDPYLTEHTQDEEPPHFPRLTRAMALEGREWCHNYTTCCIPPALSIHKTGIWLLKTLDCHLGMIEVNCDKVSIYHPG